MIHVLRVNFLMSLLMGMFLGVASAFAAQAPEGMLGGRSGMMLASQAALQLSRELRFSEDQQNELSSQLNEMADRHGWIDSAAARNIALAMQAMPTQAGPAIVKEGEAEEKEEQEDDGGKKGKAIKKNRERGDIEAVVSQFFPPELVFSLVGDYAAPWNIHFKPGEILKPFDCGPFTNFQASEDGRYVAVQKQVDGEQKDKVVDLWDMQEMRVVREIVMQEAGERWIFSPDFETAVAFNQQSGTREILVADARSGTIVQRIKAMSSVGYPDALGLAFVAADGGLRFIVATGAKELAGWDVPSGGQVGPVFVDTKSRLERFSADGKLFLGRNYSDHGSKYLFVGDTKTGAVIREIRLNSLYAFFAAGPFFVFDFENKRVAAIVEEALGHGLRVYSILVWSLETNQQLCAIRIPLGADDVPVMAFSPDGHYLLARYKGDKANIFNLKECERQYHAAVDSGDTARIVMGTMVTVGSEAKLNALRPAEEERKEKAAEAPGVLVAAPVSEVSESTPGGVSRRITVEQAELEFRLLPSNIMQRTAWTDGLNNLAKESADGKINYEDARTLYEEIKSIETF